MYFKSIKNIYYPVDGKIINVKDIFTRASVKHPKVNKVTLTDYRIQDNETPEIVAHKFYGNTRYHWILLLVNNIVDVNEEWPIPDRELKSLCEDKYGANGSGLIHHYRLAVGDRLIVDYGAQIRNPDYDPEVDSASDEFLPVEEVTNYTYEYEVNEKKRRIMLLRPEYIKDFVKTYKKLVSS